MRVSLEVEGGGFFGRRASEQPQILPMVWVVVYPGPNDFLGILLGSRASTNYGRWSSPAFDKAVAFEVPP